MPSQKTPESWEKELHKLNGTMRLTKLTPEQIVIVMSFIRDLRQQDREAMIARVEKLPRTSVSFGGKEPVDLIERDKSIEAIKDL